MVNSQRKGASAEREVAGLIALNLGIKLKRNLEQTRGGSLDLISNGKDQHWPIALENIENDQPFLSDQEGTPWALFVRVFQKCEVSLVTKIYLRKQL